MTSRPAQHRPTSRARGALILLPLIALLALTGCSSSTQTGIASAGDPATTANGSSTPDPASTADFEEQRLAFAACMRDNGVPMPDPDSGERGGFRDFGDVDRDLVDKAMQACDSLRPNGGGRNLADLTDAQKQQLLDVAACMREEGFDVPDPTFDGQGGFLRPSPGSTLDFRSDDFRAAVDKCRNDAGLEGRPGQGAPTSGDPA